MKVRKLAVALALAGGLGSGVVQALGLGEVELQSFLNETLNAEISLSRTDGVDPQNITAEIASPEAFERLGLSRNFFLNKLEFNVETKPGGNMVVNVTSSEPVREPFLNFLIEVSWPSGRLLREYSVLVDPPVYAEQSGLRDQVEAPQQTRSREPEPEAAEQSQSVQRSQRQSVRQSSDNVQQRTLAPTNASDTLWGIASKARPSDAVTMQQTMLALQDLNPDAFMNGNINRLKRGQVLRVPTLAQIRQRSRDEAIRQVQTQNDALNREPAVAAREPADAAAGAGSTAPGGDELRLVGADENRNGGERESGSAGSAGTGTADSGQAVAVAREELDSARRENSELSSRLEDMESQVDTLRRLLELKNTQLAEMQQTAASEDADGTTEGQEATTEQPVAADAKPADDAGADQSQGAETATSNAGDGTPADVEPAASESQSPEEVRQALEQPEPAEPEAQVQTEEPAAEPEPQTQNEAKDLVTTVFDTVARNPGYQLGIGGGMVALLALLLLLARRKASRDKEEMYGQMGLEADDEQDLDLAIGAANATSVPDEATDEPLAEADAYIAYGRFDQAAQALDAAISREPGRSDLRLKLLGVYADSQDRDAFEKQLRELEALEDFGAIAEAQALYGRLKESESMPSIDDLESQLRTGQSSAQGAPVDDNDEEAFSFGTDFDSGNESEQDSDRDAGTVTETWDEIEPPRDEEDFASALDDLELDEEALLGGPARDSKSDDQRNEDDSLEEATIGTPDDLDSESVETDLENLGRELEGSSESSDFSIDFESATTPEESDTLSTADASAEAGELSEDNAPAAKPLEFEDEFASLDLDEVELDSTENEDEVGAKIPAGTEQLEPMPTENGSLDESFLDELDAELEKFSGDYDSEEKPGSSDEPMDELELDVSEEDLNLMGEVADNDTEDRESELELDEELGLEDALADHDVNESIESAEEATGHDPELSEAPVIEPALPEMDEDAGDKPSARATEIPDIDESDLGDEDDFDFLAGTDEVETKLDLARAYVEMGDADGARSILDEVTVEGDDPQRAEAAKMLTNLS
ncbi:MAG: hypothetical protein KGY54_02305 [Oleiphilaceae bacterium]|nr:hypothetical protein [Oleiphilaceae bacterium]